MFRYWRKVVAVRECLRDTDCGACLYLDTDAVLNPVHWKGLADVEAFLAHGDRLMGFTPDMMTKVPTRMNAGVFAVRNTPKAVDVVDAWWDEFPPGAWRKKRDGKWKCVDKTRKGSSEKVSGVARHFSARASP